MRPPGCTSGLEHSCLQKVFSACRKDERSGGGMGGGDVGNPCSASGSRAFRGEHWAICRALRRGLFPLTPAKDRGASSGSERVKGTQPSLLACLQVCSRPSDGRPPGATVEDTEEGSGPLPLHCPHPQHGKAGLGSV